MKGKAHYQQLECIECLKLTNKMLEDETQLIVQSKLALAQRQQAIT